MPGNKILKDKTNKANVCTPQGGTEKKEVGKPSRCLDPESVLMYEEEIENNAEELLREIDLDIEDIMPRFF